MQRKITLAIGLVVASIAFVAVAGAATPITGTVTVENGTADGAQVTVTPMTQNFRQANDAVRTEVDGNQFSVDAPDAPIYLVQVVHGGGVHYEVLQNETSVSMTLNRSLSGQVVDTAGEPHANATVELLSETGYSVDRARTDQNGSFEFGPLKPNASYRVEVTVDDVPYTRTVTTDEDRSVTMETRPPTDDSSVLNVSGGDPASHIVQVMAPQNATQSVSVVETLALQNTGDRPYVGNVTIVAPEGATPYGAMAREEQTDYHETPRGVEITVTIPANSSARAAVAWDLQNQTVRKQFGHDTDSIAVVFQGYQLSDVNHSSNLESSDAPAELLTNSEPITENDTIELELPSSVQPISENGSGGTDSATDQQASAESNSMPTFPAAGLFGGLGAIVAVGFAAYRIL